MTRLVVDASALLSGIVGTDPSPPARLVDGLESADAERAAQTIARASVQLRDPRQPPSVLRDPTDDYLVALALTGRARAIVTGDRPARPTPA